MKIYEIDVEITWCLIRNVPIDLGSSVKIMMEDTIYALMFKTFDTISQILQLADSTRRRPWVSSRIFV